jgi:hypothetical protein
VNLNRRDKIPYASEQGISGIPGIYRRWRGQLSCVGRAGVSVGTTLIEHQAPGLGASKLRGSRQSHENDLLGCGSDGAQGNLDRSVVLWREGVCPALPRVGLVVKLRLFVLRRAPLAARQRVGVLNRNPSQEKLFGWYEVCTTGELFRRTRMISGIERKIVAFCGRFIYVCVVRPLVLERGEGSGEAF